MLNIKELYRKYIYGVMGTLIFHILLVAGFLVAELNINVKTEKDEVILLDFTALLANEKNQVPESGKKQDKETVTSHTGKYERNPGSNQAVNDASVTKDKFFDESYKHDIEEAKKMVAAVNKQLAQKAPPIKRYDMPEATTEGQHPDSIKNVVYSGKSNIHYSLANRYHIRLPIPVYLAKGGGLITVDIQVDPTGKVIKAEVRPTNTITDPMLPVYAMQAAERTVFNSEPKAPTVQKGTITYKFVAQ